MRAKLVLSGLALLSMTTLAHSADLHFAWEWQGTGGTPTWTLTVAGTVHGQTTHTQRTLTTTDDATCRQWAGDTYQAGETWCAAMPCPAPGAYNFLLQAGASLPSNVASVGITDQATCQKTTYEAALQTPPPPTTGTPAPVPPTSPPPVTSPPPSPAPAPASPTPPPAPVATRPVTTTPPPAMPPPAPAGPAPASTDLAAQLQALQQEAQVLLGQYRAALQTIEQEYEAALSAADAAPRHHARRVWQAYQQARRRQAQAYHAVQRQWDQLVAQYQQLVQAQAAR
jgi:hypothetical protein